MTNARVVLLAVLVLVGMIISPVCARYEISPQPLSGDMITVPAGTSLSVDVSDKGDAFHKISVDVGTGTTVNFTLWYGNGNTVDGWMKYSNDGFYSQVSETSIGGDTSTYEYYGLQEIGRIDVVGYARNYTDGQNFTSGFIVYDTVFGITQFDAMAYYEVSDITSNVIYKFEMTSDKPVSVTYYTDDREVVSKWANTTPLEVISDWIALAQQFAGSIKDFISGLFWLLKFFFIDNLLLIIALYLSVTMAYSAVSSRDIFGFYKKFFKLQKTFIEFLINLWNIFVQIIGTMVNIFVKWL